MQIRVAPTVGDNDARGVIVIGDNTDKKRRVRVADEDLRLLRSGLPVIGLYLPEAGRRDCSGPRRIANNDAIDKRCSRQFVGLHVRHCGERCVRLAQQADQNRQAKSRGHLHRRSHLVLGRYVLVSNFAPISVYGPKKKEANKTSCTQKLKITPALTDRSAPYKRSPTGMSEPKDQGAGISHRRLV